MKIILSVLAVIIVAGVLVTWLVIKHSPKQTSSADVSRKTAYVALGDSVASGAGLETMSDSSACDRNQQAYPVVLAGKLTITLSSVACSGATLSSGILGKQEVNQLRVPSQLDQLFAKPKPGLITISTGANDIQWTDTLARCFTSGCGTAADTAQTANRLLDVSRNLHTALADIKNHYGSSTPPVIVTGYYQLFPTASTTCPDDANITPNERLWWKQQQLNMDTALKTAASGFSFAHFVPVSFSGHELCTANPWIQGLADSAPFHPDDEGQAAIADQLAAYIRMNHLVGAI